MAPIILTLALVAGLVWLGGRTTRLKRERDGALTRAETAETGRAELELRYERETVRLQTELEAERKAAEGGAQAITEAMDQLVAVAKQGAGEAVAERGREVVESVKAALETKKVEANADLESRQKAIDERLKPVEKGLEKMGSALEQLDRDRRDTHMQLTTQIEGLASMHSEIRSETAGLSKAMRQPHIRGRWGEIHLRRLVEAAGMSPHCDFTEQVRVEGEEGPLRPDVVFHLPLSRDVVADSKAPLEPFLDACEKDDEKAREAHMKLYARGLRGHVKRLASKQYASQFETAPDFVLMYLPGDHFLDEALRADRELVEDAIAMKVIIATPSSMMAVLKTIAYTWQQQRAGAQAEAIVEAAKSLYERLAKFLEHLDTVGRRLDSVNDAHNRAVGSLEHRVLPAGRRLQDLGAVAAEAELTQPHRVERSARRVQAHELEAGDADGESTDHLDEAA